MTKNNKGNNPINERPEIRSINEGSEIVSQPVFVKPPRPGRKEGK
ncbi:hypothetical protein [Clostridium perfringens]|nr:hypothetical protein [Clostridium perfringens]MDU2139766.1 hypothetical protein [Streptococcus mitis]MDK0700751.1 hypothetical protein [Clostridium perfringens]MDK0732497.1 hypothetical protein [Clostridium perfringens]MDM0934229.1 hypothetical protein [Clostridium perfringens]MDU2093385.1 hypothetical protein [Clostridium perfringens]